jgi:hypothetical protein
MVCCQHCYQHFLAKDVELVAFGLPQDPVLASGQACTRMAAFSPASNQIVEA